MRGNRRKLPLPGQGVAGSSRAPAIAEQRLSFASNGYVDVELNPPVQRWQYTCCFESRGIRRQVGITGAHTKG